MRLIDADKVPEAFNYEDGSWWFQDRIDELPTVDAQPVVHAKWICEHDVRYDRCTFTKFTCSVCGEDSLERGKYCPNCGAKMDM